MSRSLWAVALAALVGAAGCAPGGNVGEGEGEGDVGEGEGEGDVGEGEGDVGEGEGEGDVGEGEGEGEGVGEGEGEGEGEGDNGVCNGDAGCSGGDVCLFPSVGDFVLDGVCGAAPAGGDTGDACTAGQSTCGRGLCHQSRCSQLCASDAECPAGMVCSTESFTLDSGQGGLAAICKNDVTLAQTACDNDADCTSSGRLCNAFNDNFALFCGFPGAGAAFGGACASANFEARNQCQTGLCDGEVEGMCTRACTSNTDCGNGFLCSGSPFTNVDGSYCAEPCATNEQCDNGGANRTCSIRDNRTGDGLDPVCIDPPGAKGFGVAAASGLECTTGLTLNGLCSKLCQPGIAGQCSGALPNCGPVTFTRPNGGDQDFNMCTP